MVNGTVSIVLTGSGGTGVMTAGNMLTDAAAHGGWYAYMTRSSGPQIRGGEAAAMIRLSPRPILSHSDHYDILVAIDWENVERFAAEMPLSPNSLVICDPDTGEIPHAIASMGPRIAHLPMKKLAKGISGGRPNMIALGAVMTLIGMPVENLLEVLGKSLKKKGPEVFESSTAALQAGAGAIEGFPETPRIGPSYKNGHTRWIVTGNEMTGLGAVRAGVRFVGAYPITPATEVLEWMAPALQKVGGTLLQAEDELASIGQIIGASYAGTPSLTATAGPGLALMTEMLGLAITSETPITVVDVQRGGPSTGIPTKSEQSDLNMAIYGMHGDAPHIVTAASDIEDCLFTAQWSVHLAEALQTAAIVMSDQAIGQSRAVINKPPDYPYVAKREIATNFESAPYLRYQNTESGVSPMSIPGTPGGQYTADGLEHSQKGIPSSQNADHTLQLNKRQRKLLNYDFGEPWATKAGEGEIAVITWGSCTAPVREAIELARNQGINARMISLRLLLPAQKAKLEGELAGVSKILVVEQSHDQQFYKYLRAHYELPASQHVLNHAGPLPVRPGEVFQALSHLQNAY